MPQSNVKNNPVRPSELFRFVRVRNPEIRRIKDPPAIPRLDERAAIVFDAELGAGSSLFPRLRELAAGTPEIQQYLELDASYRSAPEYLGSTAAIRKRLPSLLVSRLSGGAPVERAALLATIAAETGLDAANLHGDDRFRNAYQLAWDNLFAQFIARRPNPALIQELSQAVRGLDLVLRVAAAEGQETPPDVTEGVRQSYVVLPFELVPQRVAAAKASDEAKAEDPAVAAYRRRKGLLSEIAALQAAADLLGEWAAERAPPAAPDRAEEAAPPPRVKREDAAIDGEKRVEKPREPAPPAVSAPVGLQVGLADLDDIAATREDGPALAPVIAGFLRPGKTHRYERLQDRIAAATAAKFTQLTSSLPRLRQRVTAVGKTLLLEQLPDYESIGEKDRTKPAARPEQTYATKEPACRITCLGTGDLLRVEQTQICYRPGEIAHIENVLSGEERSRSLRRLRRTEENFSEEVEKLVEEERDLQSTDRQEMESEAEKTLAQEYALDAGVTVTGRYGLTDVSASLGFSMQQSSTESHREAARFSKEVVERTRRKVSERVKSSKSMTFIEEFEENNSHKLSNTGDQHKVGIYRWIDKFMRARLVRYGVRTFIQFSVPEPAAYYLYCKSEAPVAEIPVEKPLEPSSPLLGTHAGLVPLTSHKDITAANYAAFAALYGAGGVTPPPVHTVYSTDVISIPGEGSQDFKANYFVTSKEIPVQEGYVAVEASVSVTHGNAPQRIPVLHWWHLNNGNHDDSLLLDYQEGKMFVVEIEGKRVETLGPVTCPFLYATATMLGNLVQSGGIPTKVSVTAKAVLPVLATVTLKCRLTVETFERWQIDTHDAIIAGYRAQLGTYEAALKQLKYDSEVSLGDNPGQHRMTEARELKRGCLEQLLDVRKELGLTLCLPTLRMFNAITDETFTCDGVTQTYPATRLCAALAQGSEVMFFEQAFEWQHMNYVFYPYFWARKCRWRLLHNLGDVDPTFVQFLQSGMARVVLPIRPGFEAAVMNYLATGVVWSGQGTPVIGDPMFVDIIDEIKAALDDDLGPIPDTDPRVISIWEYKLPTSLVLVQGAADPYAETGLPCMRKPLIE